MKKIIAIIMTLCTALCGLSVYANETSDKLITGVYAMEGKLFYCDVPTNRVVVKSVTPVVQNDDSAQAAAEAEYLEISIAPEGLRMNDGTVINVEDLNVYTDSDVWFIVTRAANGYLSIPYFCFK